MQALQALVLTLPLSLTCGINLYATVFVVGMCMRYGWVSDPPAALEPFGSMPVIVIAGVMYVLQFIADKVQFLDNVWDLIHTLIRPLAAILIAVIVTWGEGDQTVTIIAALMAGSVSFVAHSGKAGTRMVLNVISPHENLTNTALSVTEDAGVVGLTVLALAHPNVAAVLAAVAVLLIIVVLPRVLRWGWFNFVAVVARVVAGMRVRRGSENLPVAHLAMLDRQSPICVLRAKAQKIRGAAGRTGYMCLLDGGLAFTYTKWFVLTRRWRVDLGQVRAVYFGRRMIFDEIEVHYADAKDKLRKARFVTTRYRSPQAEEMGRLLKARGLPAIPAGAAQPVAATA